MDDDKISDLSSSSSSASEDDLDEDAVIVYIAFGGSRNSPSGRLIPRVQGYVESVVSRFNTQEFRQTFRLRPTAFEYTLQLIAPDLLNDHESGHETISPEKQLLICLYYFATPVAYRCIADLFGVGLATAWRSVFRCVAALYGYRNYFIRWPTEQEALATEAFFRARNRFPGCIGIVDGSHVRISVSGEVRDSYMNRKKFCSMQFQVVCNHKLEFIHVYAGFPGSVHDMRVFKYSGVQKMCLNNEDGCFPENTHLLGDSAYNNQNRLIVPYKNNGQLTVEESHFNKSLSSNRIFVECAIGLLKVKWRRLLDMCSMSATDLIPFYITCACILHNIALKPIETYEYPVIVPDILFQNEAPESPNQESKNLGNNKRIMIKDLLAEF